MPTPDSDPDYWRFTRPGRGFGRRALLAAAGLVVVGIESKPARVAGPATGPVGRTVPVAKKAAPDAAGAEAGAAPAAPPPAGVAEQPHLVPLSDPGRRAAVTRALTPTTPEYYVHAGPKEVALTLDDGPSVQYTPKILALLERYGIRATFSMVGSQVADNRSLVAEVAAAGHAIANHTWDHSDLTRLPAQAVIDQIARTTEALSDSDVYPTVFRAPYGAWNSTVLKACASADLRPLDWSVDPRDWAMPGTRAIVSNILKHTRTGSIILEHDGGGDRSQTVAALTIVLPELLARGYRFTTI